MLLAILGFILALIGWLQFSISTYKANVDLGIGSLPV
jgi:hypothetical protein